MSERLQIKRKALSLAEKLDILRRYDADASKNKSTFSKSEGIHESTLRKLLKDRQELENIASSGGSAKKKVKVAKYEELEKILFEWFSQTRAINTPTKGPMLKEKASEIAQMLGVDFTPSNGWLSRFRDRHGIVFKQVSGESSAVNLDDVNCWKNNVLAPLLNKYSSRDVYNVDEMGLFFKLMPDKLMSFKGEKCGGGKLSKERVTVLVGANMDGTDKLKPLVIGKSHNPRCFKNVRNLPCDYVSQSKAWMTGEVFTNWIRTFDQRMQKEGRKVLCFADNCPAHPKDISGLKNVQLVFLPPNTTSVVQPMDQGVIHVLKVNYRKRVVLRHLHQIDHRVKDMSCPTCRPINLLDTMHFLSASWENVTSTTVKNCFRKAFEGLEVSEIVPEDQQLEEESPEECENFDSFATIDDEVVTSEVRSIQDIIADVQRPEESVLPDEADCNDADEDIDLPNVPTFASVTNAFGLLRLYASSLDENPAEVFFRHLNTAENLLIKHRSLRQNSVAKFFAPSNPSTST